ncbi:hypothetical protein scyTo_0016163 [Scyliorhinus torazame]|uniref:Uncharacterized protein n=1 Tax=Scyliorhinus torazame TaxID=75743 RepID=A0A401Q4M3_SCYTO|nr:hypothetical protein [Scyliorhinus torazame]
MGSTWLEKIRLNWGKVNDMTDFKSGLTKILKKHTIVFNGDLRSMKYISVKLKIKEESQTKYLKAREAVKAITNIQYLEYNDENPPVWFGYDNKGNELVTSKEEEEKTEEA